ncbi:MAG: hypothetical protein H7A46_17735 [Verrucomicrobiales bacterium]|nr:hypothetical protein [Verrucomicrobiales bacterium]
MKPLRPWSPAKESLLILVGCLAAPLPGKAAERGGADTMITAEVPELAFRNLNFESAVITPVAGDPYQRVVSQDALPGWTGQVGGETEDLALFNNRFLDSAGIGVQGPGSLTPVVQGSYMATLMAGLRLDGLEGAEWVDASLLQTGRVPGDARSLRFSASLSGAPGSSFEVSLGGQALALQVLETSDTYQTYGADISLLAGEVSTLAFTVHPAPLLGSGYLELDAIRFSPLPVPEPDTVWLGLMGTLVLLLRRALH